MREILLLSGPNLDSLGTREREIYGEETLEDLVRLVTDTGEKLDLRVTALQSNHEGELIEAIRDTSADGIVINPGALTHTSHALADAIRGKDVPTVEVHISDLLTREPWRATSFVSNACVLTIQGRGLPGYRAALRHLVNRSRSPFEVVRYGPHPDNVGDLRRGEDALVVLLHGGMWRHQFEKDTMESLAVDLNQRGFSTWNLEYRRLALGGGWPASGHDVLMALDFTRQLPVQDQPLVVVGHSAGSYLGLWASSRSRQPVDLFIGLSSVIDLEDAVASAGEIAPESEIFLQSGAPVRVDPGGISTVLVHARDDSVVPLRHSESLGGNSDVELVPVGGGHYDLLDPSKPHWEPVVQLIPTGSTYFSTAG